MRRATVHLGDTGIDSVIGKSFFFFNPSFVSAAAGKAGHYYCKHRRHSNTVLHCCSPLVLFYLNQCIMNGLIDSCIWLFFARGPDRLEQLGGSSPYCSNAILGAFRIFKGENMSTTIPCSKKRWK